MGRIVVAILFSALAVGLSAYFVVPEISLHNALKARPLSENPKRPSVIMLGDSHTEFPNWTKLLNCQSVASLGVGGDTSAKVLLRLPSAIAQGPQLIVIMAGTNDALQKLPSETTILHLEEMKRILRASHIPHVVIAPPPLPENQDSIEQISDAATLKIPFSESDLLEDRTHLRRSGYAKWRDAIAPLIATHCW